MSSLCYNDVSSRSSSVHSLSAIMEHPQSQNPQSCSPPSSSSGSPSDQFADAPFDYSGLQNQAQQQGKGGFQFPHVASLHEGVSHPYAHANVEWSASHYRRQALEELKKEERRRRRQRRSENKVESIEASGSGSTLSAIGGRVPELIGGAREAADHGRNESWASTLSGSSISTSAGLTSAGLHKKDMRSATDGIKEDRREDLLLGSALSINDQADHHKFGRGLLNSNGSIDMNAFSIEAYEKQGVPGSSGPRRFKLGMRNRATSEGTSSIAQTSAPHEMIGTSIGGFGANAKMRKGRRPSFVLREVGNNHANSVGSDMKEVLDEIIRMEKGFSLESDREMSEEEKDPLYGRTSVKASTQIGEPLSSFGAGIIPATPMAGVERARELTMNPPPAPRASSISYSMLDTPLPPARSISDSNLNTTPSHQLGHLPSKSMSSLLLPPKEYPEGNWQLSPGSGHPTKVRSRPTSVSLAGSHRHLRGLSSGQDVMDIIMGQEDVVGALASETKEKRMSRVTRELSPESQARGHKIRRSLTFENTPTGPRFPSGVILGSVGSTPRAMGMSLDTPPSAFSSMSSSRRARGKKVLDDSVTRFTFPLRLDTSIQEVATPLDGPEIRIDGSAAGEYKTLAAPLEFDTADLLTPTQSHFDTTSDYLTPQNRSSGSKLSEGGALEPSLFPPTPGKPDVLAGQDHAAFAAGIRLGAFLRSNEQEDHDMEL